MADLRRYFWTTSFDEGYLAWSLCGRWFDKIQVQSFFRYVCLNVDGSSTLVVMVADSRVFVTEIPIRSAATTVNLRISLAGGSWVISMDRSLPSSNSDSAIVRDLLLGEKWVFITTRKNSILPAKAHGQVSD